MERAGFVLKVKPDKLEDYKRHHEAVWPEMLEALRRNGWRNYSLFLSDDGTLFGYVECEDSFEACLKGMEGEDANLRWQEFMAPCFDALAGRPDESMMQLEHVFYTD